MTKYHNKNNSSNNKSITISFRNSYIYDSFLIFSTFNLGLVLEWPLWYNVQSGHWWEVSSFFQICLDQWALLALSASINTLFKQFKDVLIGVLSSFMRLSQRVVNHHHLLPGHPSKAPATHKGVQPLTAVTKSFILDIAGVLDLPQNLRKSVSKKNKNKNKAFKKLHTYTLWRYECERYNVFSMQWYCV